MDHGLCEAYLTAMEVLAKPWNGVLIVALEGGPLRFSELSARVPAIGDRMLAARLKELEAQGLVVRRVEPGPPVRVSYVLTEVGRRFREVSDAVTRWGRLMINQRTPAELPALRRRKRGA